MYPEYQDENSPTKRVGGSVLEGFSQVEHKVKMESLADVFSEQELYDFDGRVKSGLDGEDYEYVVEMKIDGLAMSLDYVEGKLNYAATRGDGTIGEDVTSNVLTIKSIPTSIDVRLPLEVRGEVFMSKKDFFDLNGYRKILGFMAYNLKSLVMMVEEKKMHYDIPGSITIDCVDASLEKGQAYYIAQHIKDKQYEVIIGSNLLSFIERKNGLRENSNEILAKIRERCKVE
jgi:hypothetical protein